MPGRARAQEAPASHGLVAAANREGAVTFYTAVDLAVSLKLANAFMQRYPLVVMPTLGDLAPPHNLDTTREGATRVLDSLRVSLISPVLGIPALAVPVGNHGRLRPGVQILAPRFREDLCLAAAEAIEARRGVLTPIDPRW